ncbi:MAG: hypothetical protein WDZ46_01725 [Solirubrobacterales bacterium]
MTQEARPEPVFPVGFDEDALAEDLARLSEGAEEALKAFRDELRREGGIPQSRLKGCHDEGQDGTCVKTYVPWPDGRFGAVFVAVRHPNRPMALRAFAFGVRHHPRESHAETVYEVADRRLRKKDA